MEPFQITQNLSDAGCEEPLINEFWRLWREGSRTRCVALLEQHRLHLLERYHREQKRIDCLDYLLYQLNQTRSER